MNTLIIGASLPPANELELFGEEMRLRAVNDPCRLPTDAADPKYYKFIALKFNVCLVLELFEMKTAKLPPPPRWHVSMSLLQDIVSGTDANFGMPEQAIIRPQLWSSDDRKDSKEIMGYLLGPVIVEETQPVIEIDGLHVVNWFTPADSRYAKGLN